MSPDHSVAQLPPRTKTPPRKIPVKNTEPPLRAESGSPDAIGLAPEAESQPSPPEQPVLLRSDSTANRDGRKVRFVPFFLRGLLCRCAEGLFV